MVVDDINESIELVDVQRAELVARRRSSTAARWFDVLDSVMDPEIPVLSIWDLGILQNVAEQSSGVLDVTITPTYSGCPAMDVIGQDIELALLAAGAKKVNVRSQLVPVWTTQWMDAAARARLQNYGIASPQLSNCPQCGSDKTTLISEYGSTACKALYRCEMCLEPFDYFKAL